MSDTITVGDLTAHHVGKTVKVKHASGKVTTGVIMSIWHGLTPDDLLADPMTTDLYMKVHGSPLSLTFVASTPCEVLS